MFINHPALLDILSGRAGWFVHRWVVAGSERLLVLQVGHHILGAGTDAELGTPDAHPGTYIVARLSALPWPEGILVQQAGYPRYRPHLSIVRVSAKLKIYACALCLL